MDAIANHAVKQKYRHPGQKKRVYIPKGAASPLLKDANNSGEEPFFTGHKTRPENPAPPPANALSRALILSRFVKTPVSPLLSEWIQASKVFFSEETIPPEGSKEFPFPMEKSIMPPRRHRRDEIHERKYGARKEMEEEDKGIVLGNDEMDHEDNEDNMPLWFQGNPADKGKSKTEDDGFRFEDSANKLEEEKKKYFAEPEKNIEEKAKKLETELVYSGVDELFEKKLRAGKVEDIFSAIEGGIQPCAMLKAVNLETIEAGLIKEKDNKNDVKKGISNDAAKEKDSDDEDMPIWNAFSAEEIKKHTSEHMDTWGLDKIVEDDQIKNTPKEKYPSKLAKPPSKEDAYTFRNDFYDDSLTMRSRSVPAESLESKMSAMALNANEERVGGESAQREESNPFCPSYLKINEPDLVWYYKDLQGLVRGPFSSADMHMWLKAGYFPNNLLIRFGEAGFFFSLGSFIHQPSPQSAYQPYQQMGYRPVIAIPQPYIMQSYTPSYGYPAQYPSGVTPVQAQMYYYPRGAVPWTNGNANKGETNGRKSPGAGKKEFAQKDMLGFFYSPDK